MIQVVKLRRFDEFVFVVLYVLLLEDLLKWILLRLEAPLVVRLGFYLFDLLKREKVD